MTEWVGWVCRTFQVEFVRAQSYVDQCSAGDVAIRGMADIGGQCLRGANVLVGGGGFF